jgi:RNA-directed DNA polymerase
MKEGMPQGGVLSPVFTTLVLCGMEGILEGKYPNEGVKIIRYVDDYLVTGRSKEIMECVLNDLREFLEIRGLTLSESKTKIVHISEGFNFIGWHFVRNNKGLEISPSVEKMDDVMRRMRDIIVQGKKWDPEKLILKLNDIVSGWGCYHAYKCTPDWFIPLDDKVSSMLWRWVKNKHPDENNQWILNQYWRNRIGSERIFGSGNTLLLRFEDIQIREPDPLDLRKNPYIDIEYFRGREKHIHLPTSERAIELKQRIW